MMVTLATESTKTTVTVVATVSTPAAIITCILFGKDNKQFSGLN